MCLIRRMAVAISPTIFGKRSTASMCLGAVRLAYAGKGEGGRGRDKEEGRREGGMTVVVRDD